MVIAISLLIIVSKSSNNQSTRNETTGEISNKQMPADEIHKGLQNPVTPPPSKENVSESYKQEIMSLKNGIEKNPNDTAALKRYADLLVASHKPEESIPLYERILKKNTKRTDILFSLSFIYFNSRNFNKAEEETKKILSIDKNNIQAQYNMGAIEASSGNANEARLIWTKLIKEFPNSELAVMARESLSKLK